MKVTDDKIISDKLNTLDTLPAGYAPNLASKWSVIEAGLAHDKQTRSANYTYRLAMAAALLLIAGSVLLFMQFSSKPGQQAYVNPAPVQKIIPGIQSNAAHTIAPSPLGTVKKQHASAHKKTDQAPSDMPTHMALVSAPADTIQAPVQIQQPVPLQAVAQTPKPLKAKRYTEFDFNEAAIGAYPPSEPVLAAQQFRFRLSLHSVSSLVQPAEINTPRLIKTLPN